MAGRRAELGEEGVAHSVWCAQDGGGGDGGKRQRVVAATRDKMAAAARGGSGSGWRRRRGTRWRRRRGGKRQRVAAATREAAGGCDEGGDEGEGEAEHEQAAEAKAEEPLRARVPPRGLSARVHNFVGECSSKVMDDDKCIHCHENKRNGSYEFCSHCYNTIYRYLERCAECGEWKQYGNCFNTNCNAYNTNVELPTNKRQRCLYNEVSFVPHFQQRSNSLGDCVICLQEMNTTSTSTLKLYCLHSFHRECLQKYASEKCPICKTDFSEMKSESEQ